MKELWIRQKDKTGKKNLVYSVFDAVVVASERISTFGKDQQTEKKDS